MPRLARGGELVLECGHLRPANECARAQDAAPRVEDLVVQWRVLCGEIDQRHSLPVRDGGHATPTIDRRGTGAEPSHSDACAASKTRRTRRPA